MATTLPSNTPSVVSSSSGHFTRLPPELRLQISDHLSRKDLSSFAATAKPMYNTLAPVIYSHFLLTRDHTLSMLNEQARSDETWLSMTERAQSASEISLGWTRANDDSGLIWADRKETAKTIQSIFPAAGTYGVQRLTINYDLMRQLSAFDPTVWNTAEETAVTDEVWRVIDSFKTPNLQEFRLQVGYSPVEFPPAVVSSLAETFAHQSCELSYIGMGGGELGYYPVGLEVLQAPEWSETDYPPASVVRIQLEDGYPASMGRGSELYRSMTIASQLVSSSHTCGKVTFHNVSDRALQVCPGFKEVPIGTPNSIVLYRDRLDGSSHGSSHSESRSKWIQPHEHVTSDQRKAYCDLFQATEDAAAFSEELGDEAARTMFDWWVDPPERPSTWDLSGIPSLPETSRRSTT